MVLEMAIGIEDTATILDRYGMDAHEWELVSASPLFRRELADLQREVAEQGLSFRAKARIQAESYLLDLDDMVNDDETPASVKLDAIKSAVKWGDLEPKKDKDDGGGGNSFNIQINL